MGEREKRSGIKSGVTAMANATAAAEDEDDVFWGGESWEFAAAGQNEMIVELGERDLEVGVGGPGQANSDI